MKRITTVLGACLLLVFFSGSVLAQKNSEKQRYQPRDSKAKSEMGIAGALEFYKLVRGNPDVSDIVNAHKAADQMANGKSLVWDEIGPDNMGGRTRAILLDKNNPSIMYAGGVAGGLWQTTTGGTSWELIAPLAENYAVSSITQDINGIIYFGTGEGFANGSGTAAGSTGFLGGGIYKSTDATGTVYTQVASTLPANSSDKWGYVYEMASSPNSTRIYACNDGGLFISDDGGTTWTNPVLYPSTAPYNLVAHDVEIGSNGCVYVVVGDKLFYSPNGNTGTYVDRSIAGTSAASIGRMEIAVAPSNPDYIYASVAKANGALFNVYRSVDGGQNWTIIGPGGSTNFNVFGDNAQGFWDNIIKVFPNDPNHILLGGIDLWDWYEGGTWIQKSLWYLESSSAYYLHADHHDIVFHPNDPNTFFHGSDGGVSKSTNGGMTFSTVNRRFATIQFYHLSCNMFDMVTGGTQDNGTLVIPGNLTTTGTAYEFLGGDGGWSAMSYINPNVIVGTVYYGDMYRSDELGGNAQAFYDERILALASPPATTGFSGFVTPMLLDEQINDLNSPDSIWFVADSALSAGTNVVLTSDNNNDFPFVFTLPSSMSAGDSIQVQDRVQTRFYLGGTGAIWMTKGLHDFSGAPEWYKLNSISGTTQCLAVSNDGNYLFAGTTGGNLYRISNLCSVKDFNTGDITSAYQVVETKLIASTGRSITSISVDPNDASNVVYTLGNYGVATHVYYSTNALDSIPTFLNRTGNLPAMPVYSSVIEMHNPNTVLIGTELGIFSTSNITAASPTWIEDNGGMGRVPVYSLVQQNKNYYYNTNYGVIYAGTHGRGAFKSLAYVGVDEIQSADAGTSIGIYPNPADDQTSLMFKSDDKGQAVVNVFSVDGKLALSKQIDVISGQNLANLNVSGLASGNYIIEIRTSSASLSGKLIKK